MATKARKARVENKPTCAIVRKRLARKSFPKRLCARIYCPLKSYALLIYPLRTLRSLSSALTFSLPVFSLLPSFRFYADRQVSPDPGGFSSIFLQRMKNQIIFLSLFFYTTSSEYPGNSTISHLPLYGPPRAR